MRKAKKEKSLSVLLYFSLFFLIFFISFILFSQKFSIPPKCYMENFLFFLLFCTIQLIMMQCMRYKSYFFAFWKILFLFLVIFIVDMENWFLFYTLLKSIVWKISKCIESQGFLFILKFVENIFLFVECVV